MPKKSKRKQTKLSIRPVKHALIVPVRRLRTLRARRAHKSFQLTRRRDLPKRPDLPGYVSFSVGVWRKLWEFRGTFGILLLVYVIASLLLVGFSQQEQYRALTEGIGEANNLYGEEGFDTMTQIAGLFGATLTGALNGEFTEIQQFYLFGVYVLMWLAIVWLFRQLLGGNAVKVRDGLYNSGAPLVSSLCIIGLMVLQALPGILGGVLFSVAIQDGVLSGGVAAMMFGVLALLLMTLSLYWMTSSFFALIMVTLPGTYPMAAVRGASEIAQGRRVSLLLRLLWLLVLAFFSWVLILLPALLVDYWMKVSWLPIVTIAIQLSSGVTLVYGAAYIFLLYRRMIDEKA